MSRAGEAASSSSRTADAFHGQLDPARAQQEVLRGLEGKQACPFCGSVSEKSASPCARCGMDNTPEARKATKARIGPWYVLQARNPAAPGMRFDTLLSFVRKGRVRARSVVRGPTTHQLWRFAAHVKGLSREFGLCFSCGNSIETTANICPQCNRLQEPPLNPDILLEDGGDGEGASQRPVYRELPAPPPAAAAEPEPPAPAPDDVDIIIPALGGFGPDDLDPKFNETPVRAPDPAPAPVAPASGRQASPAPRPAPVPRPTGPQVAVAAPPADNPFAIAPPRKKGNGDATFLSAKELAAAFKLSFDPAADMDAVEVPDQLPASALPDGVRPGGLGARSGGNLGGGVAPGPRGGLTPMSPAPAAMAVPAASTPGAPPRRGGGFRRFVLFLLIFAITGFAVLMWVDPNARQRTVEWSKAAFAKLQERAGTSGGGGGASAPAATEPSAADEFEVPDPPARSEAPAPGPSAADDAPPPEAPEAEPAAVSPEPVAEAAAEPAVEKSPAPRPQPARAAPPQAKRAAKPQAAAAAAAPAAAEKSKQDESPVAEDASERMRALQAAALAAEGRRDAKGRYAPDWAGALGAYEQIRKTVPAELWPTNLSVKIEMARKQLERSKSAAKSAPAAPTR
jgi:hypothetical protein